MAFIYGPRQVGKTTFAKSLSRDLGYLNWDIDDDRTRILERDFPASKFWASTRSTRTGAGGTS